jgi:hypothetical protein
MSSKDNTHQAGMSDNRPFEPYDFNATLSGKKLLAKIVNGVKQPTVFCPFERLVISRLHKY